MVLATDRFGTTLDCQTLCSLRETTVKNTQYESVGFSNDHPTRITFSCEETPDGHILICEDDGVGISPNVKARLFDRGFSGNAGFGLFFIDECLALSGMTIRENGKQDKGARFEITVPKGIDVTMSHSLGLFLIRFIVEHQLRGSLLISTTGGTAYTIRFPAPEGKERSSDE
ncbi:MAG: ATP-binding protein [Methanoregula sp.]|nr:ATP-binding protein [Methanoregula sp.]